MAVASKLATLSAPGCPPFGALVVGERAITLGTRRKVCVESLQ